MDDDQLLAALRDALDEPVDEADSTRIAAVRDAASQRSLAGDVGSHQAATPTELDSRRHHRPWSRRILAVAAIAIVLIAVSTTLLVRNRDGGGGGEVEYAGPITGVLGDGNLVVTKTGIGRVIELDTDDLPILGTGEFYEVWLVGPGDAPGAPNRISAGTFHPDEAGRSQVTFAAAFDPAMFPVLEITAEPGDGDPSASTDVVLEVQIG